MTKRGCEEIEQFPEGSFLRPHGTRHIMIFGKYAGAYADTIPRGYIRNYILKKCTEDLTDDELTIFQQLAPPKENQEPETTRKLPTEPAAPAG